MTTQANTTKKAEKKAIPKPGRKKSFKEASESVMKQYAEVFAKLAK